MKILELKGIKQLSKDQQKSIKGAWVSDRCTEGGPCNKGPIGCPDWDYCVL